MGDLEVSRKISHSSSHVIPIVSIGLASNDGWGSMRIYDVHSHRFAETLVSHVPELNLIWSELIDAIEGISDAALVAEFVGEGTEGELKHWSDGRPVGVRHEP